MASEAASSHLYSSEKSSLSLVKPSGCWSLAGAGGLFSDMRFLDEEDEACFKATSQSDLAVALSIFAAIVAALSAVASSSSIPAERARHDAPFTWAHGDPRTLHCVAVLCLLAISALVAAISLANFRGLLRRLNLEAVALVFCLQVLLTVLVCGRSRSARLFGLAPGETWLEVEDADEVLCVVTAMAVVVVACQFLPVRMHIFWAVPFVAAIVPPLVAIAGIPAGNATLIFCIANAVVCASSHVGARTAEALRRTQWKRRARASWFFADDSVARGLEVMLGLDFAAIARLDADGRVVEPSDRLEVFFGQAMEGLRLVDAMPVLGDVNEFSDALRTAAAGELQTLTATIKLSFGRIRPKLHIVAVRSASTRYLIGLSDVQRLVDQEVAPQPHPMIFSSEDETSELGVERVVSNMSRHAFGEIGSFSDDGLSAKLRKALQHVAQIGAREHWLIRTSDIEMMKPAVVLGRGGFGCVAMGRFHGAPVAIKVPLTSSPFKHPSLVASFVNELRLLRRVRHCHIVAFYGAAINANTGEMALIFAYIHGTDLREFVQNTHKEGRLVKREIALAKVLVDMSSALLHLHALEPPIVHGDVKCSNIKVTIDDGGFAHATLLDFGMSSLFNGLSQTMGGTLPWMAPELFQENLVPPAPEADVFSFGLLAHFTMTGVDPVKSFDGMGDADPVARYKNLTWPLGMQLRTECRALCRCCLQTEPASRPKMTDVMRSVLGWFTVIGATCEEMGPSLCCLRADVACWVDGMYAVSNNADKVGDGAALTPETDVPGYGSGMMVSKTSSLVSPRLARVTINARHDAPGSDSKVGDGAALTPETDVPGYGSGMMVSKSSSLVSPRLARVTKNAKHDAPGSDSKAFDGGEVVRKTSKASSSIGSPRRPSNPDGIMDPLVCKAPSLRTRIQPLPQWASSPPNSPRMLSPSVTPRGPRAAEEGMRAPRIQHI